MYTESISTGFSDCSHISGLSYIAVRIPLGLGVDIIQSETGQIVQTIELHGVKEVCWSANSCHLAVVIHVDSDQRERTTSAAKKFSHQRSFKSISASTGNDINSKLRKIEEDYVTNGEKYEIRVYSCNESSTLIPPQWCMWKTISAPLYSNDYRNSFSYHHMSFSFPLITLSVTLIPIDCDEKCNETFSNGQTGKVGPLQQSKVVLLDVNVCVYDEVLLFLPDGDHDGNSNSDAMREYGLQSGSGNSTNDSGGDDISEHDGAPECGDRHADFTGSQVKGVIPILCVVDVFLSSHFSPFKGHYLLPNSCTQGTKVAEGSEKREGDEDCFSFHSVFSDDDVDADRSGDTPRRPSALVPPSKGFPPAPSSSSSKPLGSSSVGGGSSHESHTHGMGSSSGGSNGDVEGSVPTYVDLSSNKTIAASCFSRYVLGLRSAASAATDAHGDAALTQLAWRNAQPSDLDSREMLLTVDKGAGLKVWSARRRELSIPVTTATRSISGAGTSCIVTGHFHTHINPDVTLLYGGALQCILGMTSIRSDSDALCVGWMEHVTCPASEQRHSSPSSCILDTAGLIHTAMNKTTDSRSELADAQKASGTRAPLNSQRNAQEGIPSFNDESVSGVWLSVLAPYEFRAVDSEGKGDVTVADSATSSGARLSKHLQYRFVCLNTHTGSLSAQAAVWGRGAIIPIGASLLPPFLPAPGSECALFSEVQQSYAVGRFSSGGSGFPFSVDIVTVLRDRVQGLDSTIGAGNCLVKVVNGVSERTTNPRSALVTDLERAGDTGADDRRKCFTVFPTVIYDLLYSNKSEGAGAGVLTTLNPNPCATISTGTSTNIRHVLPFSIDSLAGQYQTCLSRFDSSGATYRVSAPTTAPSSSSSPSSSVPNIQVLSRLGLTELQDQHQPSEALTHEILPFVPQTYGLVDMAVPADTPLSEGSMGHSEYSVIRAIAVPSDVLDVEGEMKGSEGSGRSAPQTLLVLQSSDTHGMRLMLWTDRRIPDIEQGCDESAAGPGSRTAPSTPMELPCNRKEGAEEHGDELYTAEILPDAQHGLGLRLDLRDGVIVVDSFKRHPVTDLPLPCEACMRIRPMDELLAVNTQDLKGASLSSVIQIIRSVVQASKGQTVSLTLRKNSVSNAGPQGLGERSGRSSEKDLIAHPYYFLQYHSCVALDSLCLRVGDQAVLSGDIGYDQRLRMVVLGTLSQASIVDSGGTLGAGVSELNLFHLTLDCGTAPRCTVLSRHVLNETEVPERPTLQLWRDSNFPSPSSPSSSSISLSTVYASVVSRPTQRTPNSEREREREDGGYKGLSSCCFVTVVAMQYSRGYAGCASSQRGRESCIHVVTSCTPVFSTSSTPPYGSASASVAAPVPSFSRYGGSNSRDTAAAAAAAKGGDTPLSEDRRTRFQLLLSPVLSAGSRLSQRLLLSDPEACVVLSATLWGGVAALNTHKITDTTRHPFTSSSSSSSSSSSWATPTSTSTQISSPPPPTLALCTQLLDLNLSGSDALSDPSGDGPSFCSALSADTVQIFSKNSSVHIFRYCTDLQSILHDQQHQVPPPEVSGRFFELLKAWVGFGLAKGGVWVRVGYVAPGGAARGCSPFSLLVSPWRGVEPCPPPGGYPADIGTPQTGAIPLPVSFEPPLSAALSLFQALSPLPDMSVAPPTSLPITKPSVPAFLLGGGATTFGSSKSSCSSGLSFGFGFGNMSSKSPPPSAAPTTSDSTDHKVVEKQRSDFISALAARFESLFLFSETAARGLMHRTHAGPHSEGGGDMSALAALSLDCIDEEGGGGECECAEDGMGRVRVVGADSPNCSSSRAASVGLLKGLCCTLRPAVCAVLRARSSEQSALVLAPLLLVDEGRGMSGEDLVLTFVLSELLCRLCMWCNGSTAETSSSSCADVRGGWKAESSSIAERIASLYLDESAMNCILLAMCEGILTEVSPPEKTEVAGKNEGTDTNGLVDELLRKEDDATQSTAAFNKGNSMIGSTAPPPPYTMGGTSVMNCLVSGSQSALYEVFVLLMLGDKEMGHGEERSENAEGTKEQKQTADLQSLTRLVSPSPSLGPGSDVFSFLARTRCCLWLVDVGPLGDLIGRLALQQFKAKKDSMDIFLEIVLAGQTDKLFVLAKTDKNNTGKQLLALLAHDLASETGRNILRKNAFALMRLTRYKHAAAAFLCADPPMTKEACSILCKQCEDPLLGLLVARMVEHQCLVKSGYSAKREGYILGPIARNIITTYLLPGYLTGVMLDSHVTLSSRYKDLFAMKSKSVTPSVAPRGSTRESQKSDAEESLASEQPWGEEVAQMHREHELKSSFGASGVDAVALSLVCATWMQDLRSLDLVFQHCCHLGLFSAALHGQRPLLPLHSYGLLEAFLSSAPSYSPSPCTSSSECFSRPHPLAPAAGRVTRDRARNALSSASLIRWLLVGTHSSNASNGVVEYRNRNLNFNSRQVRTVLTAVETFLVESVENKLKCSVLIMTLESLKKRTMQAMSTKLSLRDQSARIEGENGFKKACRAAFLSWKAAADQDREIKMIQQQSIAVPAPAVARPAAASDIDIFDMPYSRVKAAPRPVPVLVPDSVPTPIPASTPRSDQHDEDVAQAMKRLQRMNATGLENDILIISNLGHKEVTLQAAVKPARVDLDIFDMAPPPRRLRAPVPPADPTPTLTPDTPASTTSAAAVTSPPAAYDIFDMAPPPRRLRAPVPPADPTSTPTPTLTPDTPASTTSAAAVTSPPAAYDIFDMAPPPRRLRAPVPPADPTSTPTPTLTPDTPASTTSAAAVTSPPAAYDIFDMAPPPRRLRAPVPNADPTSTPTPTLTPDTPASTTSAAAVTSPPAAYDIFDMAPPPRRLRAPVPPADPTSTPTPTLTPDTPASIITPAPASTTTGGSGM